jgi:hypothetical protein
VGWVLGSLAHKKLFSLNSLRGDVRRTPVWHRLLGFVSACQSVGCVLSAAPCLPLWWCVVSRCGSFMLWWFAVPVTGTGALLQCIDTRFPLLLSTDLRGALVCALCGSAQPACSRPRTHTGPPMFPLSFLCVFLVRLEVLFGGGREAPPLVSCVPLVVSSMSDMSFCSSASACYGSWWPPVCRCRDARLVLIVCLRSFCLFVAGYVWWLLLCCQSLTLYMGSRLAFLPTRRREGDCMVCVWLARAVPAM